MNYYKILTGVLLGCVIISAQDGSSKTSELPAAKEKESTQTTLSAAPANAPKAIDTTVRQPDLLNQASPEKSENNTSKKLRILEDKLNSMDMYKLKGLEKRIKELEMSKHLDTAETQVLTPLARGGISSWGTGTGFGASFASVSGNTALGIEVHLVKFTFPSFERPLTHDWKVGIALGLDWWANSGFVDNDEWGMAPYLKISGNTPVFTNYLRIYGAFEEVFVYGYAVEGQPMVDSHLGSRATVGAEFFASQNYNFFAEVGIMKTASLDGATDDTGFTSVIKAGPRFWF
ncbi:hypothetical protein ACFL5V_11210 [Fibrobacterota bacterium]